MAMVLSVPVLARHPGKVWGQSHLTELPNTNVRARTVAENVENPFTLQ